METKIDNGGAAFPRPYGEGPDNYNQAQYGMSLRAWFAGQALAGLISDMARVDAYAQSGGSVIDGIVNVAYKYADAMVQRAKKT